MTSLPTECGAMRGINTNASENPSRSAETIRQIEVSTLLFLLRAVLVNFGVRGGMRGESMVGEGGTN